MKVITKLDFLIVALVMIFLLNIIAILFAEDQGLFVTTIGAVVTIVGYTALRPQLTRECVNNGGK